MLLHGMKATKKNFLLITLLVPVVLFTLLLIIIFSNHEKKQYGDSYDYYERMLLLLETASELRMKDVFDFEFDKAYVANETYGDEKYFLKKLNVDTNIDIPTLESGAHNRILFMKDNKIIYDFIYEMKSVCILETGTWVFPDTAIVLTQSQSGDGSIVLGTRTQGTKNTGDGSL